MYLLLYELASAFVSLYCAYVCLCACVHAYVCVYVCMYMCVCVCVCVWLIRWGLWSWPWRKVCIVNSVHLICIGLLNAQGKEKYNVGKTENKILVTTYRKDVLFPLSGLVVFQDVVCLLLNVPATCECISATDLLNFMCCHTEIEAADQTFYLTQSQYTDTGLTSPSADPIAPGRVATGVPICKSLVWHDPENSLAQAGFEPWIFCCWGGRLNH